MERLELPRLAVHGRSSPPLSARNEVAHRQSVRPLCIRNRYAPHSQGVPGLEPANCSSARETEADLFARVEPPRTGPSACSARSEELRREREREMRKDILRRRLSRHDPSSEQQGQFVLFSS